MYRVLGIIHPLNIKSFDQIITFVLMTCFAIIIGTATHLVWDGLTHLDFRTFAFKDLLAQNISIFGLNYPLHFILQITSSVVALPFMFCMCKSYYHTHKQLKAVPVKIKLFMIISLIISTISGMLSVWDYSHHIHSDLWNTERYFFIGKSINEFTQTGLILFTASCLVLLFLDRNKN
jgi:hypothetical protein